MEDFLLNILEINMYILHTMYFNQYTNKISICKLAKTRLYSVP